MACLEFVNAHVKGFDEQQRWRPSLLIPTTSRSDQLAHEQTIPGHCQGRIGHQEIPMQTITFQEVITFFVSVGVLLYLWLQ